MVVCHISQRVLSKTVGGRQNLVLAGLKNRRSYERFRYSLEIIQRYTKVDNYIFGYWKGYHNLNSGNAHGGPHIHQWLSLSSSVLSVYTGI